MEQDLEKSGYFPTEKLNYIPASLKIMNDYDIKGGFCEKRKKNKPEN